MVKMKRHFRLLATPKTAGYTIVELMFVLAIAGIILLLVFEAIPALQRSSRNNQRKQDISTILHAVSQYELANSGNYPLDCNNLVNPTTCDMDRGSSQYPNDYFLKRTMNKLTFYHAGDISLTAHS